MEKCANCEREIGNLEPAHIHNNAVICDACHIRLQPHRAAPPPLPPPMYAPNYAVPQTSDAVATLIPYRNAPALISYYIGLFSLLPVIGAIMGIVAIYLGIKGLGIAAANPSAKGKAHAIVGIVCGAIFGLLWILLDGLMIFGLIAAAVAHH